MGSTDQQKKKLFVGLTQPHSRALRLEVPLGARVGPDMRGSGCRMELWIGTNGFGTQEQAQDKRLRCKWGGVGSGGELDAGRGAGSGRGLEHTRELMACT